MQVGAGRGRGAVTAIGMEAWSVGESSGAGSAVQGRVARLGSAALIALALAGASGHSSAANSEQYGEDASFGRDSARPSLHVDRASAEHGPARVRIENGPPGGMVCLVAHGNGVSAREWLPLDGRGRAERPLDPGALDVAPALDAWFVGGASAGALWNGAMSNGPVHWQRWRRPPPATGITTVAAGTLLITELMKDPKSVADSSGEWIEIVNTGLAPVDIEGWSLSDSGSDFHVLSNGGVGIVVTPGFPLVLGNSDDVTKNGGVLVDYRYSGMSLSNGADEVFLSDAAGNLVDAVAYDDGVQWPDVAGASISLSATIHSPVANDIGANWCTGASPWNSGNTDLGTPGSANPVCP